MLAASVSVLIRWGVLLVLAVSRWGVGAAGSPSCALDLDCLACRDSYSCAVCSAETNLYENTSPANSYRCGKILGCLSMNEHNNGCRLCANLRYMTANASCECIDGYGESNQQCVKCGNSACLKCPHDPNVCQKCAHRYGYDANKWCLPCSTLGCWDCQQNNNICIKCQEGFGLDASDGSCRPCQSACTQCSTDYLSCQAPAPPACKVYFCVACFSNNSSKCQKCMDGFGYRDSNQNICDGCQTTFCARCPSNKSSCTVCRSGYYMSPSNPNVCSSCDPSCLECDTDSTTCGSCHPGSYLMADQCLPFSSYCLKCYYGFQCQRCEPSYGLKVATIFTITCQPCSLSFCLRCDYDQQQCQVCYRGYGKNATGFCVTCVSPCSGCPDNITECTSCVSGFSLAGTKCLPCASLTCLSCDSFNRFVCLECLPGLTLSNTTCSTCTFRSICRNCSDMPQNCRLCIPYEYSPTDPDVCNLDYPPYCRRARYEPFLANTTCVECSSGFYLVQNLAIFTGICYEICGDRVRYIADCDLAQGNLADYDGCNDDCTVEPNFTCSYGFVCSYNKEIKMNFVSIERVSSLENKFKIIIQIWPPLLVFKTTTTLSALFNLPHTDFTITAREFDAANNQVSLEVQYEPSLLETSQIHIVFQPDQNVDARYFATPTSNFNYTLTPETIRALRFVDRDAKTKFATAQYLVYALLGAQYLGVLVGFLGRKLAGLEAAFVVQLAWFNLLFANCHYSYIIPSMKVLKYSTGYAFRLGADSTLIGGQQHAAPFLLTLETTRSMLNNVNIILVLQIVPIVALVIFVVKKHRLGVHYQQETQGINEEFIEKLRQDYLNTSSRLDYWLEWAAYISLYLVSFNVLNLTASSQLMFTQPSIPEAEIACFAVSLLLAVGCFMYFWHNPDAFGPFRYSFRLEEQKKTLQNVLFLHFFIELGCYIAVDVLICQLATTTFAPACVAGTLLLYVIFLRPYRQKLDNFRAIFNLLCLLGVLAQRVYFEYLYHFEENQDIASANTLLLGTCISALAAVVMGLGSLVFQVTKEKCTGSEQPDFKDEKGRQKYHMLEQLRKTDIRTKIRALDETDNVFVQIAEPKFSITEYSNRLLREITPAERQMISNLKREIKMAGLQENNPPKPDLRLEELEEAPEQWVPAEKIGEEFYPSAMAPIDMRAGTKKEQLAKQILVEENLQMNLRKATGEISADKKRLMQNKDARHKYLEFYGNIAYT